MVNTFTLKLRAGTTSVYPSPDGLTILGTDITDRKRVELIQTEQNQLLEMAIHARMPNRRLCIGFAAQPPRSNLRADQ